MKDYVIKLDDLGKFHYLVEMVDTLEDRRGSFSPSQYELDLAESRELIAYFRIRGKPLQEIEEKFMKLPKQI